MMSNVISLDSMRPAPAPTRHISIKDIHDYRQIVLWLIGEGCNPSSYKRGPEVVRFHINRYGNYWAEGIHMFEACEEAVNNWIEAGMPKEGSSE